MKRVFVALLAVVVMVAWASFGYAQAGGLPALKAEVENLQANLQNQINSLQTQINNIKLTPGPQGPVGATGVGIQGIAGPPGIQGVQGIPGTSFDLSKLYTITSHYAPANCNSDDVSISCTAICSTHPIFTSPPLPHPLYGVPEEVINGAFGINFSEGKGYAYEDHQPGTCVAKCVVPPGDPGLPHSPPYPETYTPIIRVLCMPRN